MRVNLRKLYKYLYLFHNTGVLPLWLVDVWDGHGHRRGYWGKVYLCFIANLILNSALKVFLYLGLFINSFLIIYIFIYLLLKKSIVM